jgi:hypothetical protein
MVSWFAGHNHSVRHKICPVEKPVVTVPRTDRPAYRIGDLQFSSIHHIMTASFKDPCVVMVSYHNMMIIKVKCRPTFIV